MDFEIGDKMQIALTVVAILVVSLIGARILNAVLTRTLVKTTEYWRVDKTKFNFFKNALSFIIYSGAIIAIFYTIPALRTIGVSLLAGAGIFAAIIGFASQQAFSNIISGIFIVIFRPFRVGDFINVSGLHQGYVEDITLWHVVIKNSENKRIVIPNSIIGKETIINSHIADKRVCSLIDFEVSHTANINKAMELMHNEVLQHPKRIDYRTEEELENNKPEVSVRVINVSAMAVVIRVSAWAADNEEAYGMRCDLLKSIKERFDDEHIEMPFNYAQVLMNEKLRN
ncbi:MAG TPA: mechanosensitive ion channel protein MscS [Bacteroidales bacterium]|nr:mechanosensitive ion channel protein MscS [Bacteroidales bacterium]